MKKLLSGIVICAMSIGLAACGGESTEQASTAADQPPNLIGEWEQADKSEEADASYQTATITEDTITVYWIMEGTPALYWAGTFVAPNTAEEPYTWESENDTEKTSSALFASEDDLKTFTYENNKISYEVSALGETTTVQLEKVAEASVQNTEQTETEVNKESIAIVYEELQKYTNSLDTVCATYLAELKNTSNSYIEIDNVVIDVEDINGSLLTSTDYVGVYPNIIGPGESAYIFEEVIGYSDDGVALEDIGNAILHFDAEETSAPVLPSVEFSDIAISESYGHPNLIGRIKNTGTETINYLYIIAPIRDQDSNLQSLIFTIVDSIDPGETIGFEQSAITGDNNFDYSTATVDIVGYFG